MEMGEKPFFMWFASFDAHRPWGPNPLGGTIDHGNITPPPYLIDEEGTRQDLAKYYGEIARFDHFVGEVEKELSKQGVLDNTIIIVISDNGMPFPRSKTWLYDDGIRTPLVIKWPDGIPREGQVCQSLISVIDLAPTLLEVSGVNLSESFQGKSFAQLFNDPTLPFRNYVFAEHNWHDYESYERMVRTKDFLYLINRRPALSNGSNGGLSDVPSFSALIRARKEGKLTVLQNDIFIPRPEEAFYDCRTDQLQEHNLIDDPVFADEIIQLKSVLERWQEETGDTEPEHLTPDWYERETETGKKIQTWGTRGEMPGAATRADTINAKGPF
jgi:N-sulfoglucosamine sulfohydrolase